MAEKLGNYIIPKIIASTDENSAMEVLHNIADRLHISDDYTTLRGLVDELDGFKQRFRGLRDTLKAAQPPYDLHYLQDLRLELSFLYSELNDSNAVYQINRLKMYYEGSGKTAKGSAYMTVKDDQELLESLGSKAQKTIELASGTTKTYTEWNRLNSTAYGLFCDLRTLQDGITLVSHSVSSLSSSELTIIKQDAK